ncbi:uncharacterized protein F5891DRAFT_1182904 [Suillus fuscotomentosus]|uniref:DUF6570 domain-containing protein n=1 Tax=Suillus fuscotomentosus TaxID=1912939 RepID=A0AAD4EGJ0_9AGAM|nr:uncharacterized protein F5891DRAFT_1182904 [Suillus fuscotomentosus]KAG1905845.1 hypothetical protein F5891DRAFT_1182904 [Suillus fuscotomentosus]
MASASSSFGAPSLANMLARPVSLVISDQELPDDGSSVISSCVLRKFFGFYEVSRVRCAVRDQFPVGRVLPVTAPTLRHVVENFPHMTRENYMAVANAHSIAVRTSYRKEYIRDMLRVHVCTAECVNILIVFSLLNNPHRYFAHQTMPDPFFKKSPGLHYKFTPHTRQPHRMPGVVSEGRDDEHPFPVLLSFDDKKKIIIEWQQHMSADSLRHSACACCAHNVPVHNLALVKFDDVPLNLLRNDCLPEHTLPNSYALEVYQRAILYHKGLQDPWREAGLYLCRPCRASLIAKQPRQPVNALANFQYYGHERLPVDIRSTFSQASVYDLMLVSRARASQIIHHYAYKTTGGQYWTAEDASQRYNKGNIAIRAQDSTELRTLLPPSPDELLDTMCVIFAGHKQVLAGAH